MKIIESMVYDEIECPCCQKGEPLIETITNDAGIMIQYPNLLTAWSWRRSSGVV